MRVLLAGPDYEENLSIGYLSSSLPGAGHTTVLAAFNAAAEIGAVAGAAQDADLVGLSICFQARAREFLALAREIQSRDSSKHVVAGGHAFNDCGAGAAASECRLSGLIIEALAQPFQRSDARQAQPGFGDGSKGQVPKIFQAPGAFAALLDPPGNGGADVARRGQV